MMDYGSLPEWMSAVGSTGAVIAALILALGQRRRVKHAEATFTRQANDQALAVKKHFRAIVEEVCQAIDQTLLAFGVEQDDAAYYEQYDLFRATLRSAISRFQRLAAFSSLPLDIYLASDQVVALLRSPPLGGPLDEKVIIAIKDLRGQLSRVLDASA